MLPSVISLMHRAWCKHGQAHNQPHLASQPLFACLHLGKELMDELMPLFPRGRTEHWASQMVLAVKNPPDKAEDIRDRCLIPGSERSPGGGYGNPLQYSCWENSHGQKSLVGHSLWGHKELDTTEHACTHTHTPADSYLSTMMH